LAPWATKGVVGPADTTRVDDGSIVGTPVEQQLLLDAALVIYRGAPVRLRRSRVDQVVVLEVTSETATRGKERTDQ
jgi:hypothetical protein